MSLPKSWINKKFLFVTLKRFWFVGVIYFLALSVIPFSIILFDLPLISKYPDSYIVSKHTVTRNQGYCIFVTLLICFALSTFVFNYLHSKDAADQLHSLPPKRITLYISNILASFLLLLLPIILNTVTLLILKLNLLDKFEIQLKEIFFWGLNTTAVASLFFSIATCCAIITGTPFVQIFLSFVVLMLPSFLYYTSISNLKNWLFGYYPSPSSAVAEKINPLLIMFTPVSPSSPLKPVEYTGFFSIAIFLIVLGSILYNFRKIESAGQSIVFDFFKHIFRYGAALCGALLVGLYFPYIEQGKSFWLAISGYLIISFVCFLIAEMILNKKVNVFNKSLLRYSYFVIFLFLAIGMIKLDLFGFEKYVPQEKEIKSVVFKEYFFIGNHSEDISTFEDPEIVKMVINIHKQIIKQKQEIIKEKDLNSPYKTTLYISYNLKNGKKIQREYSVDIQKLSHYLKPLYENHTFKYNLYVIFKISPINVQSVLLSKYSNYYSIQDNSSKALVKSSDIPELLEVLKEEIYNKKFEDMINNTKDQWGDIEIDLKTPIYHGKIPFSKIVIPFEKSFTKLEKWLAKKGYIRFARIMPDEISYAIIGKSNNPDKLRNTLVGNPNLAKIKTGKKVIDKVLIDKYLRMCESPCNFFSYITSKKEIYYIIFFGKSSKIIHTGILKDL